MPHKNPEDRARRQRERRAAQQGFASIKYLYGISKDDWHRLLIEQAGRCAICRDELTNPHTDHCHTTGRVRGLLCVLCNTALGKFRDSPEILRAAITYLET